MPPATATRPSVVQVATETAEELADLFAAQIKLAHLELSLDLRLALKRVARIALFIPPLVVGYAFAMAALSSFLATYCGTARRAGLGRGPPARGRRDRPSADASPRFGERRFWSEPAPT